MTEERITEVFCHVDDYFRHMPQSQLKALSRGAKQCRKRKTRLSLSEIATICILFHASGYRTFKEFYNQHARLRWRGLFPELLSYTRFVELMPRVIAPLCGFLSSCRFTTQTHGVFFIDSTRLEVCKTKRISRHRVFAEIAKMGKSTMGWFYGFKLHLVVNDMGELAGVRLTVGNMDDRKPVDNLTTHLSGKLFGDKGYVSQDLFETLFGRGLQLVTGIRKNMKNCLMPMMDKILLRKRSVIETINDQLKNISQVEHTRHRALSGFMVNLLGALIAYSYQPKKPHIKLPKNIVEMHQMVAV